MTPQHIVNDDTHKLAPRGSASASTRLLQNPKRKTMQKHRPPKKLKDLSYNANDSWAVNCGSTFGRLTVSQDLMMQTAGSLFSVCL